jgi:hypothetical protein
VVTEPDGLDDMPPGFKQRVKKREIKLKSGKKVGKGAVGVRN